MRASYNDQHNQFQSKRLHKQFPHANVLPETEIVQLSLNSHKVRILVYFTVMSA